MGGAEHAKQAAQAEHANQSELCANVGGNSNCTKGRMQCPQAIDQSISFSGAFRDFG
jgi:hypothetical protein